MSMRVDAKRQSNIHKAAKAEHKADKAAEKATKALGHSEKDKFKAGGVNQATATTGAAGPARPAEPAKEQKDKFEAGGANQAATSTGAASPARPGELTQQQKDAGWKKEAPLIQQDPNSSDCGPAAAAMLVRAAGGGGNASDEELVKEMGGGSGQKGLEPDQLAEKLAQKGLKTEFVSDMADKRDAKALLDSGHKLVAQVDSSALHAAAEGRPPPAEAGKPHYVVVDGVTADGRLRVKDPAANTSYTVSQEQLQDAVAASQVNHGGGGLMAVRPNPNAYADWLVNKPQKQQVMAGVVGDEPGDGARRGAIRTDMFVL